MDIHDDSVEPAVAVDDLPGTGTWRELFGRRHRAASLLVAGVMLLDGTSMWVTTSLLSTVVEDIGGRRFYAWATTVFMVASVAGAMLVGPVSARRGGRGAYWVGLGAFVVGMLTAAAAPLMEVLLAGRLVQGFGVGLLYGLAFVTVRTALPRHLWARGTSLVSAAMAVGFFLGPAIGGVFAQFGAWRSAFLLVTVLTLPFVVLVARSLPTGTGTGAGGGGSAGTLPVVSLALMTGAAALISVAGVFSDARVTAGAIVVALGLVVVFLRVEKRGRGPRVLPAAVHRPGAPLRRLYLLRALMTAAAALEAFISLFGERLGGLSPLAAGFLGTTLSLGWCGTQVAVSGARPSTLARLCRVGPFALTGGLVVAAIARREHGGTWTVLVWAAAYLVAGAGVGMAMLHLSTSVLGAVDDPEEATKASAALNTIGQFAFAFGSALAGALINLGFPSMLRSARYTLAARIEQLTRLRELLDDCTGCGCLSLDRCAAANPTDRLGDLGAGPRRLLVDRFLDPSTGRPLM
ncbi:MFS transporter [Streptomyces sp. NBC_01264]|uniref:MFS transporter n=1 Tax=Streptomyces sp. NBC_01264 TaxID=2903804 RepID=UPI002255BFD8|nr:MFS transporter [Streptomyces sp. NBC_01264]MCX4775511.1 MFS transporter [Streptomyces sp. NBC_01264]